MARFSNCFKFHSTIGFNGVTPVYTTAGSDLSVYSRQSRNSYRLFTFAGLIAPVNCIFANNKCVNDYILYVHTSIKTSNEAWSTTIINKPQSWIFKLVCNSRHLLPLARKCRHFHRKQRQEVGERADLGGPHRLPHILGAPCLPTAAVLLCSNHGCSRFMGFATGVTGSG